LIRSTVAHVDLAALQANFRAIQEFVGGTRIIAVVKANAYGHGSARVGLALEQAGATMLACADIEEGIVIRQAGVRVPILVFGALSVSDLDGLFAFALTPTISTPGAARAVQTAAAHHGTTIGYHLKIDTGMNRLGFRHDNLRRTLPDLLSSPNLRLEAVYTHFASADEPENSVFNDQRERFEAQRVSRSLPFTLMACSGQFATAIWIISAHSGPTSSTSTNAFASSSTSKISGKFSAQRLWPWHASVSIRTRTSPFPPPSNLRPTRGGRQSTPTGRLPITIR